MRRSSKSNDSPLMTYIRIGVLVACVVGFVFASRIGNLFGTSDGATVAYVAGGALLIALMTWFGYRNR
jgi:undecaprenyl pyrophosphate phosphatase UppP